MMLVTSAALYIYQDVVILVVNHPVALWPLKQFLGSQNPNDQQDIAALAGFPLNRIALERFGLEGVRNGVLCGLFAPFASCASADSDDRR